MNVTCTLTKLQGDVYLQRRLGLCGENIKGSKRNKNSVIYTHDFDPTRDGCKQCVTSSPVTDRACNSLATLRTWNHTVYWSVRCGF